MIRRAWYWFVRRAADRHRCPDRPPPGVLSLHYDNDNAVPDRWMFRTWGFRPLRRLNYWLHSGKKAEWISRRISNDLRIWFLNKPWPIRWLTHLCPSWTLGGNVWDWHWQPMRCSFCVSAHPEQVLDLLREGWEVEGTGKSYKRYIVPPGTKIRNERMIANLRYRPGDIADAIPEGWSPVPPVKLYTWHLSEAQIDEFNRIIAERRPKAADPDSADAG